MRETEDFTPFCKRLKCICGNNMWFWSNEKGDFVCGGCLRTEMEQIPEKEIESA